MKQETIDEAIVFLGVSAVAVVLIFLMPCLTPWLVNANNVYVIAIVLMVEMFVLLAIVLIILRTIAVARWKFNYNILGRGKTPKNPIKLSMIRDYYGADFFKVKETLANGTVKIVGIELNLGFKECTGNLYVRFSKNWISQLKPGRMYDFGMRPV